jgi:hypothetical protein
LTGNQHSDSMSMTLIATIIRYTLPCLAVIAAGCSTPKQTQQQPDFFSQFPLVSLSPNTIHSPSGDMTARVPAEWVSVDAEKLENPQIFGVACRPDYTVSVVFNEVPMDNTIRASFDRGGMGGLLEASFARRQRRVGGRAGEMQEVEQFTIGQRKFGAYMYTTDSMQTITRVAVFFTNFHLYECSIIHLTFGEKELPDPRTLRDMHQIILGGIEW